MVKFHSIEQFRNIIKLVRLNWDFKGKNEQEEAVYQHDSPYPTLPFTGTVKLHGTNAGIVKYKDRVEFQSRENVLTLQKDNYSFALSLSNKQLDFLFDGIEFKESIAIFGEWCGKGIQSGIAIGSLPRMFVIFACKVDEKWIEYKKSDNAQQIYNIYQFPHFHIEIDFEHPEYAQNELIKITEEVEKLCPVGKWFGVEGTGEGVVWTCDFNPDYIFKVKGEKHSISKVKTLAAVDTEMVENISNFVNYAVTEQRLLQGIEKLKENNLEISLNTTGDFLRWIINDIIKEESDVVVMNQLDVKKVNAEVGKVARMWYFNYLKTLM